MSVFLIAAVTTIAVVVGICLFKKKKKVKESDASDLQFGAQESENSNYGDMFDSLLEPGDDSIVVKDKEPKDTILKIDNRSWWTVSRYSVLSYSFIIIVAVLVLLLSVFSHSVYNGRKIHEQTLTDSLRIEREKRNQLYLDNEETWKVLLEVKLDSIDSHIQALKQVKKASPRKQKK